MNTALDIILFGKKTGLQNNNAYVLEMSKEICWPLKLFVSPSTTHQDVQLKFVTQPTVCPAMC